jgi:ABC-type branched-subunit amino acid transport system ATPase component
VTVALLEVKDVKLYFGAVKAVDGMSLSLEPGEFRAIIGPNGAGKSTFFNVVAGRLSPTEGSVVFDGRSLVGVAPHAVVDRGIGVTFQVARVFDGLSLNENVRTAVLVRRGKIRSMWRRSTRVEGVQDRVDEILGLVGLAHLGDRDCAELSHGDRKALEIAIALASEPKLLLLDEPTAGMSVPERAGTVALLRRLGDELGITILFTEHDVDMVLSFADRITVMVQGRVIAEGVPEEIRTNEAVRATYLGRSAEGHDGVA